MKRIFTLLTLFVLIGTTTIAQSLPYLSSPTFQPGEVLKYKLRYGIMSAATGTLSVQKSKYNFGVEDPIHLHAFGQTSGAFSAFYTVKNQYDSYINQDNFLPILYTENIRENNYRRVEYATFDHDTKKVKGKKGTFSSPTTQTFDLVSAYYFSRNLDFAGLKKGDKFKITYFLNDEVAQLGVEYVGVEKVKSVLGELECIKLSPEISPGRIFKKNSRLYLWVTNDGNRIPVKAQVDILIGSVTMDLVSAEGLKYPLGKRVSYSK
ncbi:DUF3108 domain-containing protein [Sphingobacterium humi]|uniref:DUF3108 domain-containing protein n=1 Tax=Sphingobacterium humi TaxID=1796905 RepID=A0A6N8KZS7_9SPHI|nr:DUF3108 domain-containing protein [Sphingobacterium humi]MVZ61711.1 DUF3108 domain-containing protein [Sphingobacterium humi]